MSLKSVRQNQLLAGSRGTVARLPLFHDQERRDPYAVESGLLKGLAEYGCALLNAGCFTAGTKSWTPDGYRNVEDLRVGDLVFSRDESRPDGIVEVKPVEAVFMRFTEVVHLHVGGQTIRTTQEQPFFVYNRGWVPLVGIVAGECILTDGGDWKCVEEVCATGQIETVYNLRIADWHTYFVGDSWGWAAWAHNLYKWETASGRFGKSHSTGSYKRVTDSTYDQIWWEPKGWSDLNRKQSDPCADKPKNGHPQGIGDQVQHEAQSIANSWPSKSTNERYGSYLQACTNALSIINSIIGPLGHSALTLDLIDTGSRPPSLGGVAGYERALKAFWMQSATAIGVFVHKKTGEAFSSVPGFVNQAINYAGPDFFYTHDGRTVEMELMPDTPWSLKAHASRAMNTHLYRAVFYNRDYINSYDVEDVI